MGLGEDVFRGDIVRRGGLDVEGDRVSDRSRFRVGVGGIDLCFDNGRSRHDAQMCGRKCGRDAGMWVVVAAMRCLEWEY